MFEFSRNAFLGAIAALALSVGSSSAATFDVEDWDAQGSGNGAGIDFAVGYGANTPTGATWSLPGADIVTGNSTGIAQSPFNSNGLTGTQDYFSVNPGNTGAALTFGALQTAFSILWGSVDTYNSISFYEGANWMGTFTGTQIGTATGSSLTSATGYEISALVSFGDFGNGFNRVEFTSTSNAMEFGLAPVPLPAGGLLLIGALGGLAALRRRKTA
jgi:hypothetical protein